jgi:hypothetical protein
MEKWSDGVVECHAIPTRSCSNPNISRYARNADRL